MVLSRTALINIKPIFTFDCAATSPLKFTRTQVFTLPPMLKLTVDPATSKKPVESVSSACDALLCTTSVFGSSPQATALAGLEGDKDRMAAAMMFKNRQRGIVLSWRVANAPCPSLEHSRFDPI